VPQKKIKYYIVLSENKNYTYGAFEHSPEGLKRAEQYVKKTLILKKEKLIILEK
tara:strand:- start:302 stop:463 length:162 start_codon:yes stop_codon:yes gene_type:complete